MGQKEKRLFKALATAAEQSIRDFSSQELTNTAWAFATAGQTDVALVAALASAAEWRMGWYQADCQVEEGIMLTAFLGRAFPTKWFLGNSKF